MSPTNLIDYNVQVRRVTSTLHYLQMMLESIFYYFFYQASAQRQGQHSNMYKFTVAKKDGRRSFYQRAMRYEIV